VAVKPIENEFINGPWAPDALLWTVDKVGDAERQWKYDETIYLFTGRYEQQELLELDDVYVRVYVWKDIREND
jgi:hypothetical protein